MKNWCYADIPDWKKYQPDLEKVILDSVANTENVYTSVSPVLVESNCGKLADLLKTHYGSGIERVIVMKMTKESIGKLGNKFIHIDSGPRVARLNWPIKNPNSVISKYFKITN